MSNSLLDLPGTQFAVAAFILPPVGALAGVFEDPPDFKNLLSAALVTKLPRRKKCALNINNLKCLLFISAEILKIIRYTQSKSTRQ